MSDAFVRSIAAFVLALMLFYQTSKWTMTKE
jgi:hypothetical protein